MLFATVCMCLTNQEREHRRVAFCWVIYSTHSLSWLLTALENLTINRTMLQLKENTPKHPVPLCLSIYPEVKKNPQSLKPTWVEAVVVCASVCESHLSETQRDSITWATTYISYRNQKYWVVLGGKAWMWAKPLLTDFLHRMQALITEQPLQIKFFLFEEVVHSNEQLTY